MENNNEKQEFEFSLVSFLRIFKGKLKMLIAVGLIAAILGGTIGALSVTMSKKQYGKLLAFYFPTPEQTGYSTLIPLLESDLFTENILIGTKEVEFTDSEGNKADIKLPDLPYSASQEAELAKYEYDKLSAKKKIEELKNILKELPYELNMLKSVLSEKTTDYTTKAELFDTYMGIYEPSLADTTKIAEVEKQLEDASAAKKESEDAYNACLNRQQTAEKELFRAENTYTEANDKSSDMLESFRAEWRANPQNKETIEIFRESVIYSFSKDLSQTAANNVSKDDTSGKFLYIDIKIPENEALANKIITNITNEIADFVVSNTTPVEKNDQIECIRINTGEAKNINEDSLLSSIIKFALIFFVIIEVLACALIIFSYIKRTLFPATESVAENNADLTNGNSNENNTENE